MTGKNKGKVVWFNKLKGFGFIKPDNGDRDVFVHYSGIAGDEKFKLLVEDQIVEYDLQENEKGNLAVNVKVISDPSKVKVAK